MDGPDKDRSDADFDDDDDDENVPVPAGPFRVVLGLLMMTGGVFTVALSDRAWVRNAGAIAFLVSGLVMLKSPDKKR